jgi:hypothetical protein
MVIIMRMIDYNSDNIGTNNGGDKPSDPSASASKE